MLGGTGSCSLEELGQARGVVTDLCSFFNATLYAADVGCDVCGADHHGYGGGHGWGGKGSGGRGKGWGGRGHGPKDGSDTPKCLTLTPEKTFALIQDQDIVITDQ